MTPQTTPNVRRLLAPALRGLKANLLPALVLQAFALGLVLLYGSQPALREILARVGQLKLDWGYAFAALSTALFGGALPFCALLLLGRVPRGRRLTELAFYVGFWLWKGVEIDAFYQAQAALFGEQASPSVIAAKTAVDQFIYNPLWAAPTQTLFFLWKDCGFSVERTRYQLRKEALLRRVLVILVSTWLVWIPAVAIIYSLPSPLQIPLFNLVLCFWCLLLSFVSRASA